jgi:hypothetical protein
MSDIKYTAALISNTGVGYETYTTEDLFLGTPFEISSTYIPTEHKIELHVYGLNDDRLTSVYNYTATFENLEAYKSIEEGVNALYIDPIRDSVELGYTRGEVKLLYNFLNLISPEQFFIKQISGDRTEIIVRPSTPEFNTALLVRQLQERLTANAYFNEFRLNFLANDLLIGTNIDTIEGEVVIKLYEPLPIIYKEKSIFTFEEIISDSITFQITAEISPDSPIFPTLRSPNFNLEINQESVPPTEYLTYNDLFNYPVENTYYKASTLLSGSDIQISVNYSDYAEFVHFSSAKERLSNFKYKLELLEQYLTEINDNSIILNAQAITSITDVYYKTLISNIFAKFDDYEKFLFFSNHPSAWPKSNTLPPYTNFGTNTVEATTFYQSQSIVAEEYDNLNESRLIYTIPEFIREDPNNQGYSLFLDMIGQHFDSLWTYAKGIQDRYNADNRLDYGVSRDLIGDVLRSFGIKLYSSNFSITNLASSFLGEFYNSGSEQISQFITASNTPTPDKDILSETYKRIYHNLPYLIKTKGTERGLRALMNCFGIAEGTIKVQEFGGVLRDVPNGFLQQENTGFIQQENTGNLILTSGPYFGNENFNQVRIRVDNTGSLVSGSVLSRYVSIQPSIDKYTHDLHRVEVSISPTNYINTYLENTITDSFNIDDYIGDPALAYSSSYSTLQPIISSSLSGLERYDVYDLIRLIKFYDNQLFKMVKDFLPARSNIAAGVVIKPHYLDRSKYPRPKMTTSQPEFESEFTTNSQTGSSGGVFTLENITNHSIEVDTLSGSIEINITDESPQYNGELEGTVLQATSQNLNLENIYKQNTFIDAQYDITNFVNPTPGTVTEPSPGEISILIFTQTINIGNPDPDFDNPSI